jgi:tol-pal system protein YbgF
MTRTLLFICALALLAPGVASAQNREQQQLIAELRIIQEQTKQLQLTVNTLADAVKDLSKTTTAKLDDQQNATRKSFADAKLTIDQIADNGRVLREKVDDTNVRISSIGQEVQSLQKNLAALQSVVAPLAALIPTPSADDQTQPSAPTPAGQTPPVPAATVSVSADKTYRMAYADYLSGHWDIAIDGFQGYLRSNPTGPNADEAQFFIGESQFAVGKMKEAVASYGLVIANYKDSPKVPEAYYRRGVAYENLKDKDSAKADFEYVIKNFPDSNVRTSAQAGLLRVSKLTK